MKQSKIKNIILVFSFFPVLLLILSFEKFLITLKFLFRLLGSLSFHKLSLDEIDFLIALFFLIFFVLSSILFNLHYFNVKKIKLFEKIILIISSGSGEVIVGVVMIYLILIVSLTAPIISPQNPNFHKDISITKLLPPFSQVNYIQLKLENDNQSNIEEFRKILFDNRNEERRLYFTEIDIKDSLVFLKKGRIVETISVNQIETINNNPIIKSKVFYLGTDEFGRDLLSRLIYSTRLSLFISLLSVLVSFILGSSIGYVAGISGGFVDSVLMRIVDFFLSFPILFFVIFLIAFVGNSIFLLILVFGFSGWMFVARLARNEALACLKKEFIQSLILAGQSKFKIIINHILPNTFSPILITLIFLMSNVIIAESALSFLGLGVQPPTPTLGGIIKSGYDYLSISWWISFWGSLNLVVIVLSFNLFAEGIRKLKLR